DNGDGDDDWATGSRVSSPLGTSGPAPRGERPAAAAAPTARRSDGGCQAGTSRSTNEDGADRSAATDGGSIATGASIAAGTSGTTGIAGTSPGSIDVGTSRTGRGSGVAPDWIGATGFVLRRDRRRFDLRTFATFATSMASSVSTFATSSTTSATPSRG